MQRLAFFFLFFFWLLAASAWVGIEEKQPGRAG